MGIDATEKGTLAELLFAYQAMKNGFRVSQPINHSSPYDFILEKNNVLFRIQVKSNFSGRSGNRKAYRLSVRRGAKASHKYDTDSIDYVVAYLSEHNTFYIIPFRLVESSVLSLYPNNIEGKFFQYVNNWDLKK